MPTHNTQPTYENIADLMVGHFPSTNKQNTSMIPKLLRIPVKQISNQIKKICVHRMVAFFFWSKKADTMQKSQRMPLSALNH